MNLRQRALDPRWLGRLLAGVVLGLGLGTMVAGDPVSLPALGTVPGAVAGAVGLAAGGALYVRLPDCGCGGDGTACDGDERRCEEQP